MSTQPLYLSVTGLAFLLCWGVSAQEETLPSQCFTAENYQNYLNAQKAFEADRTGENRERLNDAEEQLIPINIIVKQNQPSSGAMITLDASESKVPSGKALFYWGSSASQKAEPPIKTVTSGTPGGYSNMGLTVHDGICGHSATSKTRVTYK